MRNDSPVVIPALLGLVFGLAIIAGACRSDDDTVSDEVLGERLAAWRAATAGATTIGAAGDDATAASPTASEAGTDGPRHLRVTVIDGDGVAEMDALGGDSDPYVTLEYVGETRETSTDEDADQPQWHDTFVFPYVAGEPLAVSLYDADPLPQPDQLLGTATIFPDRETDEIRKLSFKGGRNGTVRIRLELLP